MQSQESEGSDHISLPNGPQSIDDDSMLSSGVTEVVGDQCITLSAHDYNTLMNEPKTKMLSAADRSKRLSAVLKMINQKGVHQPNRIDDGLRLHIPHEHHKNTKNKTSTKGSQSKLQPDCSLLVSLVCHELGGMVQHAYDQQ